MDDPSSRRSAPSHLSPRPCPIRAGTLKLAQRGTEQFFSLQEGEIWNGRIAMIAILAYVVQEAATGYPTINTIPFF